MKQAVLSNVFDLSFFRKGQDALQYDQTGSLRAVSLLACVQPIFHCGLDPMAAWKKHNSKVLPNEHFAKCST